MIKYSKEKKITNEIIDDEISKISTFVNNIKNLETTISSNIDSLNKILEKDANNSNELNGCLESSKINLNKVKHLIPSANELQNTLNDMKKDVTKVKKTQVSKYNQAHQDIVNSYSKINYTITSCNNIIKSYSISEDTTILNEINTKNENKSESEIDNDTTKSIDNIENNEKIIENEEKIIENEEKIEEKKTRKKSTKKEKKDVVLEEKEETQNEPSLSPISNESDVQEINNINNEKIQNDISIISKQAVDGSDLLSDPITTYPTLENVEENSISENTSENIPDALSIASFVDEKDSNLNELKTTINDKKEKKSKKKTIKINEDNLEETKQNNKQKIDAILKKYKDRKPKKEDKISSGRFDDIKRNLSKYINLDSIENFEITNKKPKEKINFIEPISTFFQKKKEEPVKDILQNYEFKEKTLIISEKTETVTLPYTMDELNEIYNKAPNEYRSLADVIEQHYTRPLDNYKNVSLARFKEVFTLIREKEKDTLRKAFDLGLELFFNTNLHPAIISACKNLDELDIYLDYLETNEVHKFDFFKIVFEVSPVIVKKKKNTF